MKSKFSPKKISIFAAFLALSIVAFGVTSNVSAAGPKPKIDTPIINLVSATQASITLSITAPSDTGATGLPAGFSLQWVTLEAFQLGPDDLPGTADDNTWPSSDSLELCKAWFSGNANLSRYNLLPGQSVSVKVGDFLLDNGASTNCGSVLECDTTYVFRAFGHATSSEEETFSLVNVDEFNSQMDQFTGAIAAVVVPITMIILLVGGIVVMNIMLVSVTERTFEVGLRKALGATRQQILLQFLIESALLCVVGGILGLLLAIGVTALITFMLEITMTVTIGYIILSVGVSSIIGVVAGLYPAWKAARLDPIVALTQS